MDTSPTPTPATATEPRPDAATPEDAAYVARPADAALRDRPYGPRTVATTYVSGFLMGSADIVPGVSGGTIALVLGIYERLVANIRQGSRAVALVARFQIRDGLRAVGYVEWSFLAPLLVGILTAVLSLAHVLEALLGSHPVQLSAGFFGLIIGSVVVSVTELRERSARTVAVAAVVAVATFVLLGLRTGTFTDPSLAVVFGSGALAICAMILPGISGSFILLMLGLYEFVLGAVGDRDLAVLAVFAVGAVVGLGSFSTLLNWMLRRYRETVLAALIGLMAGSLRVLWPWPASEGVGDTTLGAPVASELFVAVGLALGGAVVVLTVATVARTLSTAD